LNKQYLQKRTCLTTTEKYWTQTYPFSFSSRCIAWSWTV